MAERNTVVHREVRTRRGKVYLREAGEGGFPVLLVHGNCSSSAFFDGLLGRLPRGLLGVAPDLRGYGDSEPLPVDATRGLRDFSDDVVALMDTLELERAVLLGHSLGGGVVMQVAIDHPERVAGLVLEAPMSPYGFGGTKDADGTPCWPDFAGSGGGTANPDFCQRLAAKDRSQDAPTSPRNVFDAFYVKPPFRAEDAELLLDSVLSTRVSDVHYPGPVAPSPNWPGVAPGATGFNNALSPRYCDLSPFARITPRPDVLWVRGADDQIVSDASLFCLGQLGQLGAVPGWPGADVFPPQPMVSQLRAVLGRYRHAGGLYQELVLADCGHSPHLEKPKEFERAAFSFFLEHAR